MNTPAHSIIEIFILGLATRFSPTILECDLPLVEKIPMPPPVIMGVTRSLAWCGEIICANDADVWSMTREHVDKFVAEGATLVIVDLSKLRFIDTNGTSLMKRLKAHMREQRAEILFTNSQPNVRNVLHLSCADQLLLEGSQ